MIKEELKRKCTERAKIFQQAMESCHSSSPMDCIEWFADRIAELEKEIAELKARLNAINLLTSELQKRSQLKTQQLTKTKEIIRKLVLEVKGYEEINGYDTCEPVKEA